MFRFWCTNSKVNTQYRLNQVSNNQQQNQYTNNSFSMHIHQPHILTSLTLHLQIPHTYYFNIILMLFKKQSSRSDKFINFFEKYIIIFPQYINNKCFVGRIRDYNNYQMINKNYSSDLRASQRVKFDQALYILTMYEKKIRFKNNNLHNQDYINNADECQRQIIEVWKKKWQSDLTKPILNCVISVHPRIISKNPSKATTPELAKYYTLLNQFIERLKIQQEDETNYKLIMLEQQPQCRLDCYQSVSCKIITSTFQIIGQMNKMMKQSWKLTNKKAQQSMDYDVQYYRYLFKQFQFINLTLNKFELLQQNQQSWQNQNKGSLLQFVSKTVVIMDKIKDAVHGCTLLAIQPKISQITYLIHPILIGIQGHFLKDIKQANEKNGNFNMKHVFEQDKRPIMMDTTKYNLGSKIVFINLDGYESQFNLEFARNFRKNLMYISFPKDKINAEIEQFTSKRFYKRLMFHKTETNLSKSNKIKNNSSTQSLNQASLFMWDHQTILQDPQYYHQSVKSVYAFNQYEDINQNIYIFPLRSHSLKKQYPQILHEQYNVQCFESHFVRFILRNLLVNQIRQFNPTMIMISYSRRIEIQDQHFIEICQDLTKVGNYKLILFPNFTTNFSSEMQDLDEDNEPIQFNYMNDNHISPFSEENNDLSISVDFLNKIAIFLKVGSGTYNLTANFDEQSYLSKYKNQMSLLYADQIMQVLAKQYSSIDRIKFKNKDLSILPKLFSQKIKQLLDPNSLAETVPIFYDRLYTTLENILLGRQSNQQIKLSFYEKQIIQIRELYGLRQENSIYYGVEEFINILTNFKHIGFIEVSSEKYTDKAYVYIRFQNNINQQSFQKKGQNLDFRGLCCFKFITNSKDFKTQFKILDSTAILYKNDRSRLKDSKGIFPLLIMNHLDQKDPNFQNYIIQINKSDFNHQRQTIKAIPQINILINDSKLIKIIPRNQDLSGKPFEVLSQWNFAETQNNLILFWPTQYDFLKAALYKLLKKKYEPKILNVIYISNKNSQPNLFLPFQSNTQIWPRVGCSVYEHEEKLFIFGGFYEKQKNYLNLQHDITTFELRNLEINNKLQVDNIKRFLYDKEIIDFKVKHQQPANSYVRPRRQFQFYEINQLISQEQEQIVNERTRKVIMFGGYGENFIRPYSMLTYYYYELVFDNIQRSLISVEKKIIYGKAVPININSTTKNSAIIKLPKKITDINNEQQFKEYFTSPGSSSLCRFTYYMKLKNFQYRFKYSFTDDEFTVNKNRMREIFNQKTQRIINTDISIRRFDGDKQKHQVIFCKDDKKIVVPLVLQLPPHLTQKLQHQTVALNNQSIISLSIPWDNYIYCIIQHPIYTQGKCVLAQFSISSLQNVKFTSNDIKQVSLRIVQQFKENLSMNILYSNNVTKIAIFHGERLINSPNLVEYFIHRKRNSQKISYYKIEPRLHQADQTKSQICYSVFFVGTTKIKSFDFSSMLGSNLINLSINYLDINKPDDKRYMWMAQSVQKNTLMFVTEEQTQIQLIQLDFIKMIIPKDFIFRKEGNSTTTILYLIVNYNKHQHYCQFILEKTINNVEKIVLKKIKSSDYNDDEESKETSYAIIHKTVDSYIDKGFL